MPPDALSRPERTQAADDIVESDLKLGEEAGVTYVPTVFINGERMPTPLELDVLATRIDLAVAGPHAQL